MDDGTRDQDSQPGDPSALSSVAGGDRPVYIRPAISELGSINDLTAGTPGGKVDVGNPTTPSRNV